MSTDRMVESLRKLLAWSLSIDSGLTGDARESIERLRLGLPDLPDESLPLIVEFMMLGTMYADFERAKEEYEALQKRIKPSKRDLRRIK